MPELETRFAELPDWLKSNNPPAPSWLQRQENTRRNREDQRRELESALLRRKGEQELKKAALDYAIEDQNRERELSADENLALIAPKMSEFFQNGDPIGAGNYLMGEVVKNPMITRSPQFKELMGASVTSFMAKQAQQKVEDERRKREVEMERNALTNERYRLLAEQADARAARALSSSVGDKAVILKQKAINDEIDDKVKNAIQQFKSLKAGKTGTQLQQLEKAYQAQLRNYEIERVNRIRKLTDPTAEDAPFVQMTEEAPQEMDEVEQVLNSWDKQIDLHEATQGDSNLYLKPDGTVEPADYWFGDTPAEARKKVAERRAAYYASKGRKPAATGTKSAPSSGASQEIEVDWVPGNRKPKQ